MLQDSQKHSLLALGCGGCMKFHLGIIANRVVWSECACVSGLAQKRRERERVRLGRSILSRECSMNFTLERNSLRNEIHSGII